MKSIQIGSVSIPLDAYAVQGTAILGIRESGKTYTAKGIVEQLLDHGVPVVIFDAIGVWRHLKTPAAGGKGHAVVVVGGAQPDLPLTPESVTEIVRAAIREGISLVIDLYDKNLSKQDWRKIVQACFRVLLYENHGLRHIVLEEAAEYIPQKVMDGVTYAEVEKLVRMGGNASLGITLINQRSQEVNKAVLELCENLILMRQRGANAIDTLERWMDRLSPSIAKSVASTLPNMGQGDAWVFTADAEAPVRTRSGVIKTFHPNRRTPVAKADIQPSADVSTFVSRLTEVLPQVQAELESQDAGKLRAKLAELERELSDARIGASADQFELVEAENRGLAEGYRRGWEALARRVTAALAGAMDALGGDTMSLGPPPMIREAINQLTPESRAELAPPPAPAPRAASAPAATSVALTKAERLILTALAQYRQGRSATQVAVLTGYSSNGGGFKNALGSLRSKGYVDGPGDRLVITATGLRDLGPVKPLPRGRALLEHWYGQLSKAERKSLEELAAVYPRKLSMAQLAARAGYDAGGGGFKNALGRLRTLELVRGRGELQASPDLF